VQQQGHVDYKAALRWFNGTPAKVPWTVAWLPRLLQGHLWLLLCPGSSWQMLLCWWMSWVGQPCGSTWGHWGWEDCPGDDTSAGLMWRRSQTSAHPGSCLHSRLRSPHSLCCLVFEGFGSLKCAGAFHPLCMGGMAQGKKRTCSAGFDFGGAIVLSTVRTRIRKLSHAAAESSGLMDALPLFTGRASDATVGLSWPSTFKVCIRSETMTHVTSVRMSMQPQRMVLKATGTKQKYEQAVLLRAQTGLQGKQTRCPPSVNTNQAGNKFNNYIAQREQYRRQFKRDILIAQVAASP